jgi:hypothetical protein
MMVGDGGIKSKVWAGPINGPEDAQTAKSMRNIDIQTERAIDVDGKELFFPMGTGFEQGARQRNEDLWFYKYCPAVKAGPDCCSERWYGARVSTRAWCVHGARGVLLGLTPIGVGFKLEQTRQKEKHM